MNDGRRPKMVAAPVFVLSTGRCGTLALQRFLRQSNEVEAFHRYRGRRSPLRNDMSFVLEQNYAYYRALREGSAARKARVVRLLRRSRSDLIARVAALPKRFVELNHEFSPYGPLLLDAFPEAKFIHLVRSPAPVVASFMRKFDPPPMTLPAFMGTRSSLMGQYVLRYGHVSKLAGWGPPPLRRYVAAHRYDTHVHPFDQDGGTWKERTDMSPFEKTCWYWNAVNASILGLLDLLPPDRKLTLKFEEIFGDACRDRSQALVDFIGIGDLDGDAGEAFFQEPINPKTVHGTFPPPREWDDAMMSLLQRHCRQTMESLGYCD